MLGEWKSGAGSAFVLMSENNDVILINEKRGIAKMKSVNLGWILAIGMSVVIFS